MLIAVRPAAHADLAAIAQITARAFDERISPQARHLQRNLVLVAELHGAVVGYAATFMTRSAAGWSRFELDLLAVDTAARGRGVGQALVARCIQAASESGADVIRTLVRADNLAMSRICARADLLRSARPYALYIAYAPRSPRRVMARQSACAAHLVSVDTLTYRGIWLEGELCQAAINHAYQRAQAENRSRVGALIPVADEGLAALLTANSFAAVGEFFWWSLNLRSAPA